MLSKNKNFLKPNNIDKTKPKNNNNNKSSKKNLLKVRGQSA